MFDGMTISVRRSLLGGFSFILALAVLAVLGYFVLDKPFADFSHQMLAQPKAAKWLSELGDARALFVIGVGGVMLSWFHNKPVAKAFATALLAFGLAVVAAVYLKHMCGRTWPETWIDHNPSWITDRVFGFNWMHGGTGYQSFPSGHTARSAAPCAVLWERLPRYRLVWGGLPVAVAIGLLGANFHFISDCLGGALVGVLSAHAALFLAPKLRLG